MIREAQTTDFRRITEILLEPNLPIAGIKDTACKLFVLELKKEIIGRIAYELYGKNALLY